MRVQVKEMKAELSQANEAAAESDAQLTRLSTEHRKLTAQNEALKAEVSQPSLCYHLRSTCQGFPLAVQLA